MLAPDDPRRLEIEESLFGTSLEKVKERLEAIAAGQDSKRPGVRRRAREAQQLLHDYGLIEPDEPPRE